MDARFSDVLPFCGMYSACDTGGTAVGQACSMVHALVAADSRDIAERDAGHRHDCDVLF